MKTITFEWLALNRRWLKQKLRNLTESEEDKNVAWSGDFRCDSMGHSAKYGLYIMFCTTIVKVVELNKFR